MRTEPHLAAQAPAKLLLTGEHAVLQGVPALSMAIDLPTRVELSLQSSLPDGLLLSLKDYQKEAMFPFPLWETKALEIEARYQQFLNNTLDIHAVLKAPEDLIFTTFLHFHQRHPLKKGLWHLEIHSESWRGRGLGSSASVVVATLSALNEAHRHPLSLVDIAQMAQAIESRQHGFASGVDTTTVLQGGLLKYQRTNQEAIPHFTPLPLHAFHGFLIDTGHPQSTTGECVTRVQQQFPANHPIWQKFAEVSCQIEHAWRQQNQRQLKQGIRQNHRLLSEIGIVPKPVQDFIEMLEEIGGAAKVCGAGSIKGTSAGVVLAIGLDQAELSEYCNTQGYRCRPIKISTHGVEVIKPLQEVKR
jgi:mevalonate kinase